MVFYSDSIGLTGIPYGSERTRSVGTPNLGSIPNGSPKPKDRPEFQGSLCHCADLLCTDVSRWGQLGLPTMHKDEMKIMKCRFPASPSRSGFHLIDRSQCLQS